ncbi:MAG: class I SAM-dependent methyltransferase [Pleomorphochaeta sp.]
MFKQLFSNASLPNGKLGRLFVSMMNKGHSSLSKWGFSFFTFASNADVIDFGCGGGANVKTLLKMCNEGTVTGFDYSLVSVEKTKKLNHKAIEEKRCNVIQGDVSNLPFEKNTFDGATAFETVYFWPNIQETFKNIFNILKENSKFIICNECCDNSGEKWAKIIDKMVIYKESDLKNLLSNAGFKKIETHINKKGAIIAIAYK